MKSLRAASLVTPAVVFVAWAALYGRLVPGLISDWKSDDFSHGFLIPFAALALVWTRRDTMSSRPAAPGFAGGLLIAVAIAILLVGAAASELFLQRTSMIPFLIGWIWLLEGWPRARVLLFPFLFLLFMIPPPTILWSSISFPLQLLASKATELSLHAAGIEAVREGNVIRLQNCSLEVASACSGLRSLIALLALAAILADGRLGEGEARAPSGPSSRSSFSRSRWRFW